METKFKIYTKKTITVNGIEQELTSLISELTREEVNKALQVSIQQRDRMQQLVDLNTRKLQLIDEAIANNKDSIVL
jgi:predicted metalloprotease with PDZ domain